MADEVCSQRTICHRNAREPPSSLCGARPTTHFNRRTELDLLFIDELRVLRIVDVHTHFHTGLFAPSEKPSVALETFLDAQKLAFWAPCRETLDEGERGDEVIFLW